MNKPMKVLQPNDTTKLLDKLNTIYYICGLKGYWITDVQLSERFLKIFDKFDYIIHFLDIYFPVSVLASFFTQHDLTEKQADDRLIFSIIFCGNILFYLILLPYKREVQEILYHLAVTLKEQYNDKKLEKEMLKKIKIFSVSLPAVAGLEAVFYGISALYKVIALGENFVTVIPAWPDVHDQSALAGVVRVIFYFLWYIFGARLLSPFPLIVSMLIAVCYQFKNLQSYFYSLDAIFSDKSLSQAEKEMKYEQAFKLGIQMHALTLWCKKQNQLVCKEVFAVEIVIFFTMLLTQLIAWLSSGDERTLEQLMNIIGVFMATLLSLGFFMWNSGDVTVEASKLSDAMYSSGWQNCRRQSSVRIRKLVVNAMRQAQEPVVYKTLGVVEFSYEAYVSLVRLPYTLVSVFY